MTAPVRLGVRRRSDMKRREFVEKIGMGSAGLAAATAMGSVVSAAPAKKGAQHDHAKLDGPLASAVVSFGQWRTTPPHDRFLVPSPPPRNQHGVFPFATTIKVGGNVTFNISGTHLVLVYAPGTTLESISLVIEGVEPPAPPFPGFPGFVNDPENRIYRGLNPRLQPADRTESITFAAPGTYLVVCGVVPHFVEGMHGFVKVIA
jgi:plastocyanin